MNETNKKSKLLKIRVTPDEHATLTTIAESCGGISAVIRKRVFCGRVIGYRPGLKNAVALGQMHSSLLQIARSLAEHEHTLSLTLILSQLVAIERHLNEVLTKAIE